MTKEPDALRDAVRDAIKSSRRWNATSLAKSVLKRDGNYIRDFLSGKKKTLGAAEIALLEQALAVSLPRFAEAPYQGGDDEEITVARPVLEVGLRALLRTLDVAKVDADEAVSLFVEVLTAPALEDLGYDPVHSFRVRWTIEAEKFQLRRR